MLGSRPAAGRDAVVDDASLPLFNSSGQQQAGGKHTSSSSGSAGPSRLVAAPGTPQQHAEQLARQAGAALRTLVAPLAPVAVLCLGIYVTSLEAGGGRPIDREHCDCSCWDGRFKGRHGLSTHGVQYKSVYFNLEPATALLVAWCCCWLHVLGLCLQRLGQLWASGRLSYAVLLPALLQFYPMFYASWAVFNYVNDRFYVMLPSQLFFQATELVSCYFIYALLDSAAHKQLQPLVPVLGLSVAATHILLALKERVLWGLFLPGINTVNGRDVMLVAGDAACLVLFARLLARMRLPRRELLALLPWGVGVTLALVVTYVAGFGYVYTVS